MRFNPTGIKLKDLRGDFDLGFNATGVIQSSVHFTGEEIIIRESMPAQYVQQCFDEVARLSENAKKRRPGGKIRGRIPFPIYGAWRREWEKTGKLHGLLWSAFLNTKLMDRDYSRLRVQGV